MNALIFALRLIIAGLLLGSAQVHAQQFQPNWNALNGMAQPNYQSPNNPIYVDPNYENPNRPVRQVTCTTSIVFGQYVTTCR